MTGALAPGEDQRDLDRGATIRCWDTCRHARAWSRRTRSRMYRSRGWRTAARPTWRYEFLW